MDPKNENLRLALSDPLHYILERNETEKSRVSLTFPFRDVHSLQKKKKNGVGNKFASPFNSALEASGHPTVV